MPLSAVGQDLRGKGKDYYGDPCYDSTFGSTLDKCEEKTTGASLAHMVLSTYGINISAGGNWIMGDNALRYGKCCPLDILNQDPFSCIKMSLTSSLLDHEYWEVYADEYGEARFVRGLPEENARTAVLPRVQYCVPSLQPADIANLVVIRSADPPPFRKCGEGWYDILDGASQGGIRNWVNQGSIFPGGGAAADARGVMFTWGEVTGMGPSVTTDPTCELGTFDKYGTIIYPDYERKQVYNDGVVDYVELEGFEQILFWLVDVDYNVSDTILSHYSIQFVKSSDVPIPLGGLSVGETYNGHTEDFGSVCDLSETGEGTGTTPNITLQYYDSAAAEAAAKAQTCKSVQDSISAAKDRQANVNWSEYSIPSFFGYGFAKSTVSFNDYSKWNIVGADECVDDPIDNIYESTSEMMANGCPLKMGPLYASYGDWGSWVSFGYQQARRTMTLPANDVWVESTPQDNDSGILIYSFRAKAPDVASIKIGDTPWQNGYYQHMLTTVAAPFGGSTASNTQSYKYPGYLFGWGDGLYTIEELFAKVRVARPGISIQGFGRGVESFLPNISMKIKPVYQIDFPAAVAAKGENYDGCVDVYKDLARANQSYCKDLPEGPTEAEKLQEAMTGTTIEITLPFLFPDFRAAGQYNPSQVKDKSAFDTLCTKCLSTARWLWSYVKKYKDEGNKGFTYVCGPPRIQTEVPRLGDLVSTEAGDRTINSISYNYQDSSSFTLTVEVGPVSITAAHTGSINKKSTRNEDVKGKIVNHGAGALYKVDVPGLGVIQAWNIDKYPWDVGDKVTVTLYNHPREI